MLFHVSIFIVKICKKQVFKYPEIGFWFSRASKKYQFMAVRIHFKKLLVGYIKELYPFSHNHTLQWFKWLHLFQITTISWRYIHPFWKLPRRTFHPSFMGGTVDPPNSSKSQNLRIRPAFPVRPKKVGWPWWFFDVSRSEKATVVRLWVTW